MLLALSVLVFYILFVSTSIQRKRRCAVFFVWIVLLLFASGFEGQGEQVNSSTEEFSSTTLFPSTDGTTNGDMLNKSLELETNQTNAENNTNLTEASTDISETTEQETTKIEGSTEEKNGGSEDILILGVIILVCGLLVISTAIFVGYRIYKVKTKKSKEVLSSTRSKKKDKKKGKSNERKKGSQESSKTKPSTGYEIVEKK
ncbi:hypothetical protein Mgra_00004277 [Meloidogyne graminicola]|uniref:Uncharacterized protein n=1 Tax=Meloidogyne graminicola TaxID=189291 RepID=A0A8S9ZRQ0_9BILA|nr:hypothetical protein Mgra_00004277 [Meloidogyne graminicola]